MIFKTRSGSTYEVDYENKRCRRLHGVSPTTERTGPDGEWRQYEAFMCMGVGYRAFIEWTKDCPVPAKKGLRPGTVTTPVTEIVP